jgi:preprotein translocase subunit SecA
MHTPAQEYRHTAIRKPGTLLSGLDALVYRWAGKMQRGEHLMAQAEGICRRERRWKELSNQALRERLGELRLQFRRRGRGAEKLVPDALGALREAADRCLGLRPYDVQLAGALALNENYVAEMATGEGKTLTASLTAIMWGWRGLPCHIITVNDYLAHRDAEWLAPLYRYCGVSAGFVTSAMDPAQRRTGYGRDVTYTTSKELVADFLRDRLWLGPLQHTTRRHVRTLFARRFDLQRGLVTRGIHSAIVDEADSILIDEAVTPLIISRPQPNTTFVNACERTSELVAALRRDTDYRVDYQYKDVELLPALDQRIAEGESPLPAMFRGAARQRDLIRQALVAREFFERDKQYIVDGDKVVIVDEFTGRSMPQRTYSAGLHQMIEAKEGLPVTPPSETLARLSFQRFFRFFHNLAGMTGTAREAASELWHIYGLPVATIPQNKPCRRSVLPRRVFAENSEKWDAIVKEIVIMHGQGRPVLVGTRSVRTSEDLSRRLEERGLPFRVLNAVRHQEEARIVAHAGQEGTITVATNMAGRGTDIVLGQGIAARGGLHVIATECHESQRIDRQLFGRCARQGDPGSARSFVSLEDELIGRYVPRAARDAVKAALRKNIPQAAAAGNGAVAWAQSSAQRMAAKSRRSVLQMDTWLDDSLSFAHADVVS